MNACVQLYDNYTFSKTSPHSHVTIQQLQWGPSWMGRSICTTGSYQHIARPYNQKAMHIIKIYTGCVKASPHFTYTQLLCFSQFQNDPPISW